MIDEEMEYQEYKIKSIPIKRENTRWIVNIEIEKNINGEEIGGSTSRLS
jgi:hypothetical protein